VKFDVIVLGGGLAGLSAARDLLAGGADVLLLEARDRPGGRVEQTSLADGRLVQLGGEVIGEFHTAYRALVAELGLTVVPAFPAMPGEDTTVLREGHFITDGVRWLSDRDLAEYERVEGEFIALSRTIDPDDPWGHPEAAELDRVSVGEWLRSLNAPPAVLRARNLSMAALSAESIERTSLLADLRKEAAAGSPGFYDYDRWESHRVAEGSASVALQMADELGHRLRLGTPVAEVSIAAGGCSVISIAGERFEAEAVLSTLPVAPLRRVRISGVSAERLRSLGRQRHALASKVVLAYPDSFWESAGQNGSVYAETGVMGGTWPQREGIISALVPAERLAPMAATAPELLQQELLLEAVGMFGERAAEPDAFFLRHWYREPFTEGYITAWRPGDVMSVGPLHGTHDPPFYVAGSDQWVCGYMEGAVRTGRAAARAALGSDEPVPEASPVLG
jgi:monoamine oxidase